MQRSVEESSSLLRHVTPPSLHRAVLTYTRRMDAIEDNASALSGGLCRVDDSLDELRRQQTTIRLRVDELRARGATAQMPPSPAAPMPASDGLLRVPVGIFAEDDHPSDRGDGACACLLTSPVAYHGHSPCPLERHRECRHLARCQAWS